MDPEYAWIEMIKSCTGCWTCIKSTFASQSLRIGKLLPVPSRPTLDDDTEPPYADRSYSNRGQKFGQDSGEVAGVHKTVADMLPSVKNFNEGISNVVEKKVSAKAAKNGDCTDGKGKGDEAENEDGDSDDDDTSSVMSSATTSSSIRVMPRRRESIALVHAAREREAQRREQGDRTRAHPAGLTQQVVVGGRRPFGGGNPDGRRCFRCNSADHFIRFCPVNRVRDIQRCVAFKEFLAYVDRKDAECMLQRERERLRVDRGRALEDRELDLRYREEDLAWNSAKPELKRGFRGQQ